MKKAEIIIASLTLIALGMNLLSIPGGTLLTVLTILILSTMYFYLGFAILNNISIGKIFENDSYKNINKFRILGSVGTGFALATTLIGILFKIQSWPRASINLCFGLVCLSIVAVIGLIKFKKNQADYYKFIFIRVAVFGGIGLFFLFAINKR